MKTVLALLVLIAAPASAAEPFAIRDGDTVVFLGDSITAEGTYGRVIEKYTVMRYPNRKVRFINAGWGGDTAEGGLKRLQRDVLDRGATLVTVAYGINDIGWGGKADAEHRQRYLDGIRGIVEACKAKQVRVFICSAAATASDPDKSVDDFLQKMCDDGMKISKENGEGAIDVLREMRTIQRRIKQSNAAEKDEQKRETLHAGDGIHLNDLGETAMGFAILKGLGAPQVVSAAVIDADGKTNGEGCEISNLKSHNGVLEFDRWDEGLPVAFGLFGGLKFRFIPLPDEINRYMLTVRGLKTGDYQIEAARRNLGKFSADALAKGVNLAGVTADPWVPGGPWEAQGWLVNDIVDGRFKIANTWKFSPEFLKENPARPVIDQNRETANVAIEELARMAAMPVPYHFIIRPSPPPASSRAGKPK